ncbi:flagellar export protein FliJ [Comamonas kerstersii]|uniref:Flagellar FliJ protein n=1 Tax=Comamonas kerstersii TaxID=225992 RepID=A0A0W7Z5H6_9BURK|nr:flagellar export protein FliJ [Comamonas kerstersii]MDO4968341.1 flagellar export protein FliJ [Comamonadaceae bacterium]AQZ97587.1 flagellar export protein FliJ [Comamonas kerstersii]KAB0584167.1 flagellar export protein FliJ [Comamonas kerstersii]KUF42480.1 flagellar export protein FliJ [Comamonas kerstersii]OOH88775.1 flagellar export protein FliJ [Comamonas kerstersii]
MSSLNALMIAIEMAVRKRDDARQALRERQHAFDAAKSQMEQLENYAAEMQQRWGATEGASLKPEVMVHHRQFMERLEHAINLQTRVIADQSIRLEAAQKALMAAELRLTSLNKVVETRRRDMELAQMRREQKQTDERAALQFIGRTFGMQFQEA